MGAVLAPQMFYIGSSSIEFGVQDINVGLLSRSSNHCSTILDLWHGQFPDWKIRSPHETCTSTVLGRQTASYSDLQSWQASDLDVFFLMRRGRPTSAAYSLFHPPSTFSIISHDSSTQTDDPHRRFRDVRSHAPYHKILPFFKVTYVSWFLHFRHVSALELFRHSSLLSFYTFLVVTRVRNVTRRQSISCWLVVLKFWLMVLI